MPVTSNSSVRLLVVDDDPQYLELIGTALERDDLEIQTMTDPIAAMAAVKTFNPHIVLSDMVMPKLNGMELLAQIVGHYPSIEVVLLTGHYTRDAAVEAIKMGASDFLGKPVPVATLRERISRLVDGSRKRIESEKLADELVQHSTFCDMIGRSESMQELFRRIMRVAPHYLTALITGPTGSGKELVARALRSSSPVASGPFVVVNCAAIVDTLFESELFGHVKGSFTGAASDRTGMFEAADGGTLFLDEIEELPLAGQAKLLRVLQERQVQRVGAVKSTPVDVRVIAATNRNLRDLVVEKKFREDLLYRLAMVEIPVPPLSERREDIELLVHHFVDLYSQRFKKPIRGLSPAAKSQIQRYHWPGNIRELENAIGNAMMMADHEVIEVNHLPPEVRQEPAAMPVERSGAFTASPNSTMAEVMEMYLSYILKLENGNVTRAATRLAVPRSTLYQKLKELNQ